MKLKTITVDGKTYAVLDEAGLPIYTHDDGKDIGFDAVAATERIGHLNGEATAHRTRRDVAEAKLKTFEGIEDPKAALAAMETVANLDSGTLIAAGQVEKIKSEASRAAEERVADVQKKTAKQLEDANAEREAIQARLHKHMIGTAFGNSKFITEKIAVHPDIVKNTFGQHFRVGKDDKWIVLEDDGTTPVFSRKRPGEPTNDFEEAIEILVDRYPHKDQFLKGTGSGTGATGGTGRANGKDLSGLSPTERINAARGVSSAVGR